jgi:hypothetical protein
MARASIRYIRWFLVASGFCLLAAPLAAQDRYLRLDDGLYELNADGTYHKVQRSTTTSPRLSGGSSRPATTSSTGRFTGQERFIRFDDGLYQRMADGTYTKVEERRLTQSQSQSGRYGASSTSTDPRWQQQFGHQHITVPSSEWSDNSRPPQWSNRPPQWSNRPPQWSNNSRPPQWNNSRPPQANNSRPPAIDSMLNINTWQGQETKAVPMEQGGQPGRYGR